jgi:hypothetical protein
MTNPAQYLSRSILGAGIAAGLCTAAIVASSAAAAAATTQTLRFYDHPVSLTLHRADGTMVTRAPYPQAGAGDVLDVVSLDYRGDHAAHAKRPSASTHLRCTFAASGPPACVSHVAVGSSMLVLEGNPGTVTLGTGRYLGATGRVVSSKELANDATDVVVRIVLR